jgi:hypothetical protein
LLTRVSNIAKPFEQNKGVRGNIDRSATLIDHRHGGARNARTEQTTARAIGKNAKAKELPGKEGLG